MVENVESAAFGHLKKRLMNKKFYYEITMETYLRLSFSMNFSK